MAGQAELRRETGLGDLGFRLASASGVTQGELFPSWDAVSPSFKIRRDHIQGSIKYFVSFRLICYITLEECK